MAVKKKQTTEKQIKHKLYSFVVLFLNRRQNGKHHHENFTYIPCKTIAKLSSKSFLIISEYYSPFRFLCRYIRYI